MKRFLPIAVLLAGVSGCSDRAGKAVVDDYPGGGGYKIVSIDGASPVRASSAIANMVPYVLVQPGDHSFQAITLHGTGQFTFKANVAADTNYRVVSAADGNLTLVEVKPPANSN